MANKKEIINEKIKKHGENLIELFRLRGTDPVKLTKSLVRLENKAHRLAEDWCNGYITEKEFTNGVKKILESVDKLLGYKRKGIPVIVNSDPRGYALKIHSDYVYSVRPRIMTDWGGYGIIAPDFREI